MRAQDFPGWLAAIAGLSAEQRGEAVLALAKAGEGAAAPEDLAAPSPGKRRAKRTEDALGTTSVERVESRGWSPRQASLEDDKCRRRSALRPKKWTSCSHWPRRSTNASATNSCRRWRASSRRSGKATRSARAPCTGRVVQRRFFDPPQLPNASPPARA